MGLPSDELRQVRGGEIGFVFQEPMTSLNPVFTVGNQLDETLRAHTKLSKEQRKHVSYICLSFAAFRSLNSGCAVIHMSFQEE